MAAPDISLLPALSAYFGVTIDELFALSDATRMGRIENMLWDVRFLNAADVEKMSLLLKERLPDLEISAEVCFATRDRQNAVRLLAQKCSLVLVVGSEKSSNTKRLLETAIQCGAKAYLVPRAGAVKPEWFRGISSVGVTSGASCPESLLQDVCAEIRHITGE